MNVRSMCRNCESRFVGCHSQCQKYVVAKVIHSYKRDKRGRENELTAIPPRQTNGIRHRVMF